MNGHDVRDIPDAAYRKKTMVQTACYRCGLYDPEVSSSTTCEEMIRIDGMKIYQAGGDMDPFAGYRDGNEHSNGDEKRPGLVHETIDRDAYDAFMRAL